ncbi:hypothetical protein [Reinekea marinisedimentorum]|uniref:Lipoprotein n=1 Tax=Reinekea marinisedimentorum TaxID=230495 RepID=A0A4R3HSL4_9GAMM|nr:hypothetical protein [Reinekea marinisedimentorum]TCS36137.1 hypothetical protein BCF53_12719 [Reinekea marinisedimentorum]
MKSYRWLKLTLNIALAFSLLGCATNKPMTVEEPKASDYLQDTNLALEIEFRKPLGESRLLGVYLLDKWMGDHEDIFQVKNLKDGILFGSGQNPRSAKWYNQSTNYFDFFAFENSNQLFIQFFNFKRSNRDGQEPFPITERDQMSITQIDQKLAGFLDYSIGVNYPLIKCIENTLNYKEEIDYCRNLITNDKSGKIIERKLY